MEKNRLVQKHLAMLITAFHGIPQTTDAIGVRSRTLKKATVAPNGVIHAILGGPMEF